MNYRHAFHAGNFADVVKHAVLARILTHLRDKPQPFRVIDTHAGAGLYDLAGPDANRTGEWRAGIGRLTAARLVPPARDLLAPYLDAVAAFNRDGQLRRYPGSPLVALSLMRPQDRLIACELEPNAAAALTSNLRADKRAKAIAIDGFVAINAYVPPKERRGLVLIDPPFEAHERIHPARQEHRGCPPQMGDRHLPRLVSAQGSARGRRAGDPYQAQRHCKSTARGTRPRQQPGAARRHRFADRQSALAAGGRACDSASSAGRRAGAGGAAAAADRAAC